MNAELFFAERIIQKLYSDDKGYYDCLVEITDVDNEWIYVDILADVRRSAKFDHSLVREDGEAYLTIG